MAFKLSKEDRKSLSDLIERLDTAKTELESAHTVASEAISNAVDELNTHITAYNTILTEAREFVDTVVSGFKDEYDEKSEKWQESDAAQAATELIDAWEEVDLADLDEAVLPELDELTLDHNTDLGSLPTEKEG